MPALPRFGRLLKDHDIRFAAPEAHTRTFSGMYAGDFSTAATT